MPACRLRAVTSALASALLLQGCVAAGPIAAISYASTAVRGVAAVAGAVSAASGDRVPQGRVPCVAGGSVAAGDLCPPAPAAAPAGFGLRSSATPPAAQASAALAMPDGYEDCMYRKVVLHDRNAECGWR